MSPDSRYNTLPLLPLICSRTRNQKFYPMDKDQWPSISAYRTFSHFPGMALTAPVMGQPLRQVDNTNSKILGKRRRDDHEAHLLSKGHLTEEIEPEHGTSRKPKKYETPLQLLEDLRACFFRGAVVDFTGSYTVPDVPEISDKNRIKLAVTEIWHATGYRFTVKDHPTIKDGHKTRLWCSQDQARKNKARNGDFGSIPGADGDPFAKTRYPCRSRLIISSRKAANPSMRLVTIRLYHHASHEPYHLAPGLRMIFQPLESMQGTIVQPMPSTSNGYTMDEPLLNTEHYHDDPSSEADLHAEEIGVLDADIVETDQPPTGEITQQGVMTEAVFQNRMRSHISTIRDFCDGLEYQLQFSDFRMLEALEREGASFLRFMRECLDGEARSRQT